MTSIPPESSIELIDYNGKKIFFADFSRCETTEDILKLILEGKEVALKEPDDSILALQDFTDKKASKEIVELVKKVSKETEPKLHRQAVVGVTSLQRVILNGVNRLLKKEIKAFSTKEEALEYLTKED